MQSTNMTNAWNYINEQRRENFSGLLLLMGIWALFASLLIVPALLSAGSSWLLLLPIIMVMPLIVVFTKTLLVFYRYNDVSQQMGIPINEL